MSVAALFFSAPERRRIPRSFAFIDITNYLPKFKPQTSRKKFLRMRPGADRGFNDAETE
jgi:hypothetical protein